MPKPMNRRRGRALGDLGGPDMGPSPNRGEADKARDFKGSIRSLVRYLAKYKYVLITAFVCAALSSLFSVLGPKILAAAIDVLIEGMAQMLAGTGSIDFGRIGGIMLLMLGLYGIVALFSLFQGMLMADLTTKVSYQLRRSMMEKIGRLPLSYFQKNSYGDVLSRVMNDVDVLSMNLNQSITQLITSIVTMVGVLIMMLTISWVMTVLALLMLPLAFFLIWLVVKKSQKYFVGQQKHLGSVSGHVEEMYGGHLIIKAFSQEDASIEAFDRENDRLYHAAWKSRFLSGLMMPLMRFVNNLGYVVICIVGAAMAAGGALTIGGIQAFIQYLQNFMQPVTQMANLSTQIQQMAAASERIFAFLEEEEEQLFPVRYSVKELRPRGDIDFIHVRFTYPETDKVVIRDFTASVKAGQKVALVGPTGVGKTTMVKLLMRFYELDGGAIELDSHNITDFAREDLRTMFGMVLQDTWLFSGTIMENIRYGRLDATDEEVIAAAKAAQVDHFIRTLPGGYQMEINEEATNISQGQKQLITIARAILSDAKIMILDEATSSVDTRTEILIQKAMDNLMEGRTSFIIAHRLSTIRNADLILVLREGDVVEQGTHAQLLQKGGQYARLYQSQFEDA